MNELPTSLWGTHLEKHVEKKRNDDYRMGLLKKEGSKRTLLMIMEEHGFFNTFKTRKLWNSRNFN